jgi:hypothetical protein
LLPSFSAQLQSHPVAVSNLQFVDSCTKQNYTSSNLGSHAKELSFGATKRSDTFMETFRYNLVKLCRPSCSRLDESSSERTLYRRGLTEGKPNKCCDKSHSLFCLHFSIDSCMSSEMSSGGPGACTVNSGTYFENIHRRNPIGMVQGGKVTPHVMCTMFQIQTIICSLFNIHNMYVCRPVVHSCTTRRGRPCFTCPINTAKDLVLLPNSPAFAPYSDCHIKLVKSHMSNQLTPTDELHQWVIS